MLIPPMDCCIHTSHTHQSTNEHAIDDYDYASTLRMDRLHLPTICSAIVFSPPALYFYPACTVPVNPFSALSSRFLLTVLRSKCKDDLTAHRLPESLHFRRRNYDGHATSSEIRKARRPRTVKTASVYISLWRVACWSWCAFSLGRLAPYISLMPLGRWREAMSPCALLDMSIFQ